MLKFGLDFLEWGKLGQDVIDALLLEWLDGDVLISPDVNSLHIVWRQTDAIFHEIEDYPEHYEDPLDWLEESIGDDSWEIFEGETDIYKIINESELGEISPNTIKTINIHDISPEAVTHEEWAQKNVKTIAGVARRTGKPKQQISRAITVGKITAWKSGSTWLILWPSAKAWADKLRKYDRLKAK